jgi:hypothetical protein
MSFNIPYKSGTNAAGVTLAADLTFPDDVGNIGHVTAAITTSSSLGTVLSLTGKYIIDYLYIAAQIAESSQIKLTVDSVVIWDDTSVTGTVSQLIGMDQAIGGGVVQASVVCENSFLFEMSKATDTTVTLDYLARPIV